jgi:membrane protein
VFKSGWADLHADLTGLPAVPSAVNRCELAVFTLHAVRHHMSRRSRLLQTGRQVVTEVSEKNVTFMAAGIAYNAFISLAPVLVLLLVVVSAVGSGLEERVVAVASGSLPGPIADVVVGVFEGEGTSAGASVVSLVVVVWGTLKVFRGLDTAFAEIYETAEGNSFADKLGDGFVVLVGMLVAVLATVGVTAAFASLAGTVPFVGLLTPLVLVTGLVLAFLPMYYRFPNADVDVRDVLPGVVFAAVGWAAFQALFQMYIGVAGGGSGNFFGGVIVVVTWLYFSGLVLLLGAVINAVVGGHASGKAGGVGRGASGYETRRDESMDRDEFAAYLGELREQFTGHYEGMRPTAGENVRALRRPTGDVEVVEQTTPEGDGQGWEVAFRWRSPDGDSDGAPD